MWMVDSGNNHTKQLTMPATDPIYGRKLRPLMPRPITGASTKNTPYSSPSCCCIRNPNILQWNHPMCGLSDYGVKREIQSVPLVSTRWNPTPEQLQALEEMYRRGIRTPSAEQIQQIAAKLRRFGKIEGKNVFYWFQNHKARERQKKRRQLELLAGKKMHHPQNLQPETGLSRKSIETEHQKLPTISNCNTPPEDSLQHKILSAKNERCWHLDFSSPLSPPPSVTAGKGTAAENDQTLQLFPVGRIGSGESADYSILETKFRPNEFIEFLPTKK